MGADTQYGIFPSAGLGVDLNKYLTLESFNTLKLRVGYGVTGSLPNRNGLSQDQFDYAFTGELVVLPKLEMQIKT